MSFFASGLTNAHAPVSNLHSESANTANISTYAKPFGKRQLLAMFVEPGANINPLPEQQQKRQHISAITGASALLLSAQALHVFFQ